MAHATDEYLVRELRADDADAVLETFDLVFGADDPTHVPRTRAAWEWAYARNPAGRRAFVALTGERVVAHYAALPARVWCDGAEYRFAQVVDSFVHPDHRGGGRLFVRTARAFFDAYGGPDRDAVFFGWPVERALVVGRRKLGYEVVRTQLFLARELGDEGPLPAGVERVDDPGEQVRWLYDRCLAGPHALGASTVRDAAWFRWRFRERPDREYRALGVRDSDGCLRGLCVLGLGRWPLPDTGLVIDWLVPPDEREVADALVAGARSALAAWGARRAVALFPEASPWFADFQERGFLVHPSDYRAVARSFHPRFDATWLRDHWWYQLSDTDLA